MAQEPCERGRTGKVPAHTQNVKKRVGAEVPGAQESQRTNGLLYIIAGQISVFVKNIP
jgi:hypothetical protein